MVINLDLQELNAPQVGQWSLKAEFIYVQTQTKYNPVSSYTETSQ